MTLSGLPLLALVVVLTGAAAAATFLGWHRGGPVRIPLRLLTLVTTQALVVLTAGLIYNRAEQFYPSWQALAGQTGTTAVAQGRDGRLDAAFTDGRVRSWQPPGSDAWQLSTPPTITVPDGYTGRDLSFPVLLAVGGPASPVPSPAITVTIAPGPQTRDLPGLPASLGADLRTTSHGWVLVVAAERTPLAASLITEFPGRFAAVAVVGSGPAPAGLGIPVRVVAGWADAVAWASARTTPALAPPQVLPTVIRP